jgi:hypothetical protein
MTNPHDWNQKIIAEFRANDGRVGGQFDGAPVLLLTTTGAKTGKRHTTPMMYLADGDRLVVFASVTVEVGTDEFEATATATAGSERETLFARQAALYPGFGEYQEKTTRVIPVVALSRNP